MALASVAALDGGGGSSSSSMMVEQQQQQQQQVQEEMGRVLKRQGSPGSGPRRR
jgi:hypothetical protein